MRRYATVLAVLLCLCGMSGGSPAAAAPGSYGRYHALVIGNNDYTSLPKLRTARNDAQDMARVLREKYGFSVRLLENAKRADILTALGDYRRELGEQDNLLVYYAGHGYLDKEGDEGYWLPVDAERDNSVNWVSNASITTEVKAMQARHVLIISDSCYSGKLARGLMITQKEPGYMEKLARLRARVVLTSGGLEPVPDAGGKGGHSVFATALIGALEENTGTVEGTEIFSRIRRPVMLNSDQTPEYSDIRKADHEGGDFIFAAKEQPEATTGALLVETVPDGATVLVDGERKGEGPLALRGLAPGSVKVRAEASGYQAKEETVLVRAGKRVVVRLLLEKTPAKGSVTVTSVPPGASWYLDAVLAGTTPDTMEVPPGSHRVAVSMSGYEDWSATVTVAAGQVTRITAELRVKAQAAPEKIRPVKPADVKKKPAAPKPERDIDIIAPTF